MPPIFCVAIYIVHIYSGLGNYLIRSELDGKREKLRERNPFEMGFIEVEFVAPDWISEGHCEKNKVLASYCGKASV